MISRLNKQKKVKYHQSLFFNKREEFLNVQIVFKTGGHLAYICSSVRGILDKYFEGISGINVYSQIISNNEFSFNITCNLREAEILGLFTFVYVPRLKST
jgi:hypothetical protein